MALALAVASLPLVSIANEVEAVTYGDPVESPQIEFPEVVPVWVGGRALCTGTLIQQQIVLTAAHCVYGESGPFQISVGGSKLNDGRLIDIDATWYHPRWDARYIQNDIALLHLKSPANVSRLGILPSAKLKSLGKKFLIVGWGKDQNGSITGQLHRLSLNDQSTTAAKVFKSVYNPKTMLGAGRYFPDEMLYGGGCNGDSGGPLFQGVNGGNRTIIGLTSFGADGCTVYKPTIFTRVDFYVNMIQIGLQVVANRAITSPIGTGNGTNPGIGPTTTTTIPKMAPLTVKYEWTYPNTDYRNTDWGGTQGIFKTNLPNEQSVIKKVCFTLDGSPLPQYSDDWYRLRQPAWLINGSNFTQSGGPGCFELPNFSYYYEILLLYLPKGSHTLISTVTDRYGRTASSDSVIFIGR
jgi:hypothetical protein